MAARLDLEARLRALRSPAGVASSSSSPAPIAPPPPLAAASSTPPQALAALPVAPGAELKSWPEPPLAWPEPPTARPRRASSALGEVLVIPRRGLVGSGAEAAAAAPAAPTDSHGVSVASLLGPAYTEAVRIAQYAIESERSRNAHTAIDAYIRAGQMLIGIGRQQDAAHLQTIVKKKALALLERAEGLSDWVSAIMAGSGNDAEAVDAAFAESQRAREQALTEKEALVAKMRTENSEMTQKLNQLVLLTKVRARFRRVLSERRARKAAAAAAAAEEEARHGASLEDAENNANSGNCNDVEGDSDGDDKREQQPEDRRASFSSSRGSLSAAHANQAPRERETQKRDLVNELHARIGLPEISSLRKFAPLSTDATKDLRHVELEDELDAARLEAERLRAAVHEMEEAFRATLEHTRQQSLRTNQQKDEDLAHMEDELQRVRDELERERRLTASSFGGSNRSFQSDDDDPDAYEDIAMIRSLRSSLHAIENPAAASDNNSGERETRRQERAAAATGAASIQRRWSKSESEGDSSDVDDDGGVWL